ncbi:MAG: dihydroorotase [Chitinophagales bacterium]|nr:dihydroorotase [Chitinophagales bacterium]MDW8428551.1 dihydroorotase [Chitinophagales bacterium]
MGLLIRSVTLIDQQSPFHLKCIDVRVADGRISQLGQLSEEPGDEVFDASGCYLSAGWIDLMAFVGEPGREQVETVSTLLDAAAAGGFTGVVAFSEGNPVPDHRVVIGYLKSRAESHITELLPAGTLSKGRKGLELAEILLMNQAGAIVFGDMPAPVVSSGFMMRALLYAKNIDACIYSLTMDPSISPDGQVHESTFSVQRGIRSLPEIAEEIIVTRDLVLVSYTGRPLHFACVSTTASVRLIRQAKKQGIKVTAAVPVTHLLFDETKLDSYNTYWKLFPPLRSQNHVEALREGLVDGTLDAVCSMHRPCSRDEKLVPFDQAAFGMINLQTCFALLNQTGLLTVEQLVEKLAIAPRRILNLPMPSFEPGSIANFTIFDVNRSWTFTPEMNRSKSENSPLFQVPLKGKPIAIYNRGKFLKI